MSIHAERGPEVRHPGAGMLLVLIAALASTAVLVLAITGSFDGSSTGKSVSLPAVSGVRADGGPEEGTRGIVAAASGPAVTRIGVRGVPLPAAGQPGGAVTAGAAAQPSAPRIGIRGVPLPVVGQSGG